MADVDDKGSAVLATAENGKKYIVSSSSSSDLDDGAIVADNGDGSALFQQESSAPRPNSRETSYHDISYHPSTVTKFYCHPYQRQKWGETQVIPRVNYGDLFFDLFFVAGAYNVANILNSSPTARGMLYFVGTFVPMMNLWRDKLFYDARYSVSDDIYHRVAEIFMYIVVGSVILHIRTLDVLSNPRDHKDMFAFCCALTLGVALNFYAYVETYFFAKGERKAIKNVSIYDILSRFTCFVAYMSAAIVAGLEYYNHQDEEGDDDGGDGHRILAAAGDDATPPTEPYTNDIPIELILSGAVSYFLFYLVRVQFCFPNDGSHKLVAVPINVGFTIHRDGEWIMLMLGESILSLLIVDVTEGEDYYLTFFGGILTVILLQYLHYQSQPHDPDHHALRRNKDAGIWWTFFNTTYSAALVCVGVSFKLFLSEFSYEEEHRLLASSVSEEPSRLLAGSGAASLDPDTRRQAIAYIYSGALAIVWLSLDAMCLLHNGIDRSYRRCRCTRSQRTNKKGLFLVLFRVGLVVFTATMGHYETDSEQLVIYGLITVVLQLLFRWLGVIYFPSKHMTRHETHSTEEDRGGEGAEGVEYTKGEYSSGKRQAQEHA